jgi:nitrate reductase NapE component
MNILLTCAVLIVPGILPAVVIAGRRPVTPFLVPLATALMAGVAVLAMFVTDGSLVSWFAVVAAAVNLLALAALLKGTRLRRGDSSERYPWITFLVVLVAVLWPLAVLRVPVIGYDAQAIWLLHAAMVFGGHNTLVADMTNPSYLFSNPDYPPLSPGLAAVVYVTQGRVDYHLGVAAIAGLNACTLGVVGTGVMEAVQGRTRTLRWGANLLLVAFLCGAIYGVAGQYAVDGYADLLWAGAAVGATLYGLVLSPSRGHFAVACVCLAVAALTKNEGFVTSVIIACLIATRMFTCRPQRARVWLRMAALGAALAPTVGWIIAVRSRGLSNSFLGSSPESTLTRLSATTVGMWGQLHLVVAALCVLLLGALLLRSHRVGFGLANPAWLWAVAVLSTLAVAATYVFGSYEIHWWLASSVNRTTIFANSLLLTDMAVWAVVAMQGVDQPAWPNPVGSANARLEAADLSSTLTGP